MAQHIGVVACSAEGAALCYKTICLEGAGLLGPLAHPEVSMHTHSLAEYVRHIRLGDWQRVGELMQSSAKKLAQSGADFLICPDNTLHQALDGAQAPWPLPWLHIADVVAAEAAQKGYRRLALLGTRWLLQSEVYPARLRARGLQWARPLPVQCEEVSRLIMEELVCGVFNPDATAYLQRLLDGMRAEGCDAVVLGCTELPLLLNDGNSPLPTLDSTRLLARAALRRAVQGAATD